MTQELRTVREAQAADPSPRRLRSGLNAMTSRTRLVDRKSVV